MPTIEIDDAVLEELSRRATGFNVTPNDVVRRILQLPPLARGEAGMPLPKAKPRTFSDFVTSDTFQRHQQSVDRFLVMLGWLHTEQPQKFAEAVLSFQRGRRLYFAKSEREIVESGENVTARAIPDSPFWVLTTLDNRSKRLVIEDVLRALGHPSSDIEAATRAIPDSGIRRSRDRSLAIALLDKLSTAE